MNFSSITKRIVTYFRLVFLWAVASWLLFPQYVIHLYSLLTPAIILGMYIWSLDIEYKKLFILHQYRKKIAWYFMVMMIILPVALFYLLSLLSLDIATGVFLLAAAPAWITAIVFTRLMWWNTLLSLCLAVITTVSFPFIFPLLSKWVVWSTVDIDTMSMFIDLILYCILPLIAAYCTQFFRKKWIETYVRPHLDWASIILVAILIAWPVAYNAEIFLSTSPITLFGTIGLLFLVSLCIHVAWWLCFLWNRENQIAGSLAKWFMSISIATVVAAKYFSPTVLLVVILYEFPRDLMLVPFWWYVKKTAKQ